MAIISRLKLDHPALGTAGGSALHTSIEAIYTKIGDMTNSRFFTQAALANGASQDFEHGFNVSAFDDLRYDLYLWNSGTGEITEVTVLTGWSILATPSFEKTKIRVTNNTGSSQDIALVVLNDPININELVDVDTAGAEEGQTLVYDSVNKIWIPGASGDSSFKFQKVVVNTLTVKNGYLILEDGRELYAASDLSVDLSSYGNGDYYGYIDLFSLPASSLVSGRELIAVSASNFVFSTTVPKLMNLARYIPRGYLRKAGGVWTIVSTLAFLRHESPLGANNSTEYVLSSLAIGNVGDLAQVRAGHVLAQGSFPSAAYASTSFFNLSSVSTINDGNTTLAHNLTNNGTTLFDQVGIVGVDDQCPGFNGTTQYLSSTDAHFNPGDSNFVIGFWVKPNSWVPASNQVIISQWQAAPNQSFNFILATTGLVAISYSTDGTTSSSALAYDVSTLTGWHHFAIKYVASENKFYLYLDGILVTTGTLPSGLWQVASPSFRIANQGIYYFAGLIDEFFFCNGNAFTDDEISKIYSAKISHNRSLAANQQDWSVDATYAGITREISSDVIVDKDSNDLYWDLSSLPATATVEAILQARGAIGTAMAANARFWEGTAANLDTLIGTGVSFGFPSMITACSLFVESPTSDRFEAVADTTAYLLFESISPYRLMPGATTFTTAFGASAKVKLVVSSGNQSVAVNPYIWNNVARSGNFSPLVNDRNLVNTSGGAITATLPLAPRSGDEIEFVDARGSFGTYALTLGRNGKPINGAASDYDCDVSGKRYKAVFVDDTYGWAVTY
jgi:hypothetical protein